MYRIASKAASRALGIIAAGALALALLQGCGRQGGGQQAQVPHEIRVGVVPGPYRVIMEKYLKPVVEKRGHKLSFV